MFLYLDRQSNLLVSFQYVEWDEPKRDVTRYENEILIQEIIFLSIYCYLGTILLWIYE